MEDESQIQRLMSSISMGKAKAGINSSLPSLMSAHKINYGKFWEGRQPMTTNMSRESYNNSTLSQPKLQGNSSGIFSQKNGASQKQINFPLPYDAIRTSLTESIPEAGDVEDLENWAFDMKRVKRRSKLKGGSNYPMGNKKTTKISNDKGETRLMMEMIDTIMAKKEENESMNQYHRNKESFDNSNQKQKDDESEKDEDSGDEETKEKPYVYRAPAKIFGNANSKIASSLNNFKINQDLLRQVLIRKMNIQQESFMVYKDDEGALRHKTRDLTLNTISRFKYLKEIFRNSTEVIKESYRLANLFKKDGKVTDEQSKQEKKKRTKKELLIEFKMMVKELKENLNGMSKDEGMKADYLKGITLKRNAMVEMYNKKIQEVKIEIEEIKKVLEELPKKIASLKKSMKKGINNKDLVSIIEDWQKKQDLAIVSQKECERKKANIVKEDYEDIRLLTEDVVKLEMDLKNIKNLKQENRVLLKNILFQLMAGNYSAEYYEMSLVDVKLELNKLKIEQDGRKICPMMDNENINFIDNTCETISKIDEYEEKMKEVIQKIREEAGVDFNSSIIVVKSMNRSTKRNHNLFTEQDAKFFDEIDKKLRDPKLQNPGDDNKVMESDELADIQHILLDHKRLFDQLKEKEEKRMLKMYENFQSVKQVKKDQNHTKLKSHKKIDEDGGKVSEQLGIMVKHFALLFGVNSAVRILAGNFIKYKKALKELYDPELK